jgi:diadenosine tetraphosphatase ApaH/serine/threonine PP2A family protein phosphatase
MADLLDLSPSEFRAVLSANKHVQESALISLFTRLRSILKTEPNLLRLFPPITVCGDIHGQLLDLFELFTASSEDIGESNKYLFLGDYVDRGYSSIETFAYLAYLKIKHPSHLFLLRGNHESREVSQQYGLYQDCLQIYGHGGLWHSINSVFDWLPIAAVVANRVFCVHGGLSPSVTFIEQISTIRRNREIDCFDSDSSSALDAHAMIDLTWSDPEEVARYQPNRRGKGYFFGPNQTRAFLRNNRMGGGDTTPDDAGHGFVARSHQIAQHGYKWVHRENLVIVWSAPNYCYKMDNDACVMKLEDGQPVRFVKFDKNPNSHIRPEDVEIAYFA